MALIRKHRNAGGADPNPPDEIAAAAAEMEHWDLAAPDGPQARAARGRRQLDRLMRGLTRAAADDTTAAGGPAESAGGPPGADAVTGAGTDADAGTDGATGVVGGRARRMRGLTDRLLAAAPRIPVRDLATLRAQHPNASNAEELADLLVAGARRASAAVGAGVGAAAVAPTPPAMAVEIAAETLAVAAVEIKLIAELHEVYGRRAAGNGAQRTTAYLAAWADRRGIDSVSLVRPSGVLALSTGSQVRRRVGRRLTRSSVRKLPTLAPFLVGAVIGAQLNRRDTARLAAKVRTDLRRQAAPDRSDRRWGWGWSWGHHGHGSATPSG